MAVSNSNKDSVENKMWTDSDTRSDMIIGNTYRMEYIKHLVSVATATLVFSIAFMKDILGDPSSEPEFKLLLAAGWLSLVISIIFGILHMRNWSDFYISWSLKSESEKGKTQRNELVKYQRNIALTQISTFLLGLIFMFVFAVKNLHICI